MSVERQHRLRRLAIRSWRRGTKEMDLILGRFWDENGDALDDATLDLYEDLLSENDQDLYLWCSGQGSSPPLGKNIPAHRLPRVGWCPVPGPRIHRRRGSCPVRKA